ncbi:hypothetical protein J1N09_01020 [Aureitalea sp. L0-47]|uniref:hypothetical protein n=1 Tax=Aureitalea sp. L0-47 TaxID=2816962 RepID=UPI002237FF02|nr:hypothetical protein [Aureitalea sp. L0-47]MCW5518400.1 hypothetical protein [Aureitalea sp. L0-47]
MVILVYLKDSFLMRLNTKLLILALLAFITTSAQEDYEYIGAIKLNDTSFISYKINFNENDGLIQGYSITDLGGSHETMSYLSGSFDSEKDEIEFYESGIIYTKSYITQNDFCYVHFAGRLKRLDDRQGIQGSFKGLYDNGESCINGSIEMLNFRKVLRRAKRLDKKIDRTILISKEKRDKVNLVNELERTKINMLKKDEVLNVFTNDTEIKLRLYDAGQEDGDRISLYINDSLLLDNYTVSNTPKEISVTVEEPQTTLLIQALNAGTVGGNTVKLELVLDESTVVDALTNLKEGEKATLVLRKR